MEGKLNEAEQLLNGLKGNTFVAKQVEDNLKQIEAKRNE